MSDQAVCKPKQSMNAVILVCVLQAQAKHVFGHCYVRAFVCLAPFEPRPRRRASGGRGPT